METIHGSWPLPKSLGPPDSPLNPVQKADLFKASARMFEDFTGSDSGAERRRAFLAEVPRRADTNPNLNRMLPQSGQ